MKGSEICHNPKNNSAAAVLFYRSTGRDALIWNHECMLE
jgi:hypothetical protein